MQKPLIILAKHSITITPAVFGLLLGYIRFYIWDHQTKLEQYRRRGETYRVQTTDETTSPEHTLETLQRELAQAQELAKLIEPAQHQFARLYEQNFEALAQGWRNTRIHLELNTIEEMYSLKVALFYQMEQLKANPAFSKEKFLFRINQ